MYTVGPGIWRDDWKMRKKEKLAYWTWNMARNTEKRGKWEINLVWSGIWGENLQMKKMRNSHVRTWNMIRNNEKRAKRETHCAGPGI